MIPLLYIFYLLTQDVYEVEGVVITATRYPMMLKDVAVATRVIERQDIERLNPRTLGELLRSCAGMDIRDYGTGSLITVSLRGIPASGVLILIDGQPLNSIQNGIADLSLIDVSSIERIEIIKGPTSSLYGANGLGGAINIITRKEELVHNSQTSVNYECAKEKIPIGEDYYLNFNIPLGDRFFATINGTKSGYKGERTNSDLNRFLTGSTINYRSKRMSIISSFNLTLRDFGVPGPKPLIDSLHPVPYFGDSTATSKFDRQMERVGLASFDFNYKLTRNVEFQTKLFTNLQRTKYHTKYFYFTEITEDYDYGLFTSGVNTSIFYQFNRGNLLLGLDYRRDTLNAKTISGLFGETKWQAVTRNYGLWTSGNLRVRGSLNFNLSLRYDRNTQYGDFLSPQLGMVVELFPRLWLKPSLGRAFRAPGFNDLYWPNAGNTNLKPEIGDACELRLETSPKYNIYTAFSVFLRRIKDRIAWLPEEGGLWKPQNINWTRISGGEIEVRTKLGNDIKVSLDGTYLHARQKNKELVYYDYLTGEMKFEEKNRKSAFIPDFTTALKIDLPINKNLNFNITNSYTSSRENYYEDWSNLPEVVMNTKRLAGFYLLDMSLKYTFLKSLTLSIGIKNLLDTKFATQFGNSIYDYDYPMPGRTIFTKLKWEG